MTQTAGREMTEAELDEYWALRNSHRYDEAEAYAKQVKGTMTEKQQWEQAMARFMPFGTVDQAIAQMGELAEACNGHITGANVIVESAADGHRYEVVGMRWEPSGEHPEGRLILVTSDCVHWSEDCDKKVVAVNEPPAVVSFWSRSITHN